ncbi:cell death abnormality protein 1-like [Argopecten irradians]|uniref:cell death abnormality protein 1-like n=1 Tax=Argopecten irradians TaxID=31199 RepID=UPI003714EE45
MEGWIGRTCSQGCQTGLFGPGCSEECHCRIPGCNHINGACITMGCEAGWSGQACNQPCTNHTFGRDCNQTCHCANSDCDGRTGVCKVPGCLGWIGNSCSQAQKQPGATTKISHGEEQTTHTQCTTGYAVVGSLLAVSISCNIGLIVYCLR